MANSTIKKFLDAGAQFTEMSKKQADGLVRSLVKSGEIQRKDAEKAVQQMLDRGRETTERVAHVVQKEVAKQFTAFSERFDDLEDKIEEIAEALQARVKPAPAKRSQSATSAPAATSVPAATSAPAKKAPAKKAPAKKAAAKKAPAKKAAAKKAPAKKAAAKKAPAVGSSGVRKVTTRKA